LLNSFTVFVSRPTHRIRLFYSGRMESQPLCKYWWSMPWLYSSLMDQLMVS